MKCSQMENKETILKLFYYDDYHGFFSVLSFELPFLKPCISTTGVTLHYKFRGFFNHWVFI